MRSPSWSSILRTLYALSSRNATRPSSLLHRTTPAPSTSTRAIALKSMPAIPFLSNLFSSSSNSSSASNMSTYPVQKSTDEWKAVLNKEQFRVLREKGTEAPHTGKYDSHSPTSGVYTCAGCAAPLYTASHKFQSGCGWPAYFDSIPGAVERHTDNTFGMARTEIVCANCGGHLGHVFKGEGYKTPTDERHCVNSVSLNFSPEDTVVGKEGK